MAGGGGAVVGDAATAFGSTREPRNTRAQPRRATAAVLASLARPKTCLSLHLLLPPSRWLQNSALSSLPDLPLLESPKFKPELPT